MDETPYYVAVVPINPRGEVLIGKRREDGIWTTPAGGANPGEGPEACAIRECWEEAQLKVDKDRLEFLKTKETPNGKWIHCYLYRTGQMDTSTAGDPDREVNEWLWVSSDELPKELSRKKNQNRLETINEAFMEFHGLNKADNIISLTEKLRKGGPGSGIRGHRTIRPDAGKVRSQAESILPTGNPSENKKFPVGKVVNTPDGKGEIIGSRGDEVLVELDSGKRTGYDVSEINKKPDPRGEFRGSSLLSGDRVFEMYERDGKVSAYLDGADVSDKFGSELQTKQSWELESTAEKILNSNIKKGGPGSGVRGHKTAQEEPAPKSKLQAHLEALKNGAVLPGMKTQSGKPVVLSMEAASAHGYDVQDHVDAMNTHHQIAMKTQETLNKLKTAGQKIPEEGAKIAQFHEKKMKEHMRERQRLEQRKKDTEAAVQDKKDKAVSSVKKSITMGGEGQGARDINIGDFSQATATAIPHVLEKLHAMMDDYQFGDEPRTIHFKKGDLHLAKVDDGLYTGFFTKVQLAGEGEMADNSKVRIEQITLPELAKLIEAKEWDHTVERVMPEPDYEGLTAKLEGPPEDTPIEAPTVEQKIRLLELVNKLIS